MATGAGDKKGAMFSLAFEDKISGSADAAADSLEGLRARMQSSQDAMSQMRAAMNRLRGTTDEVKRAKEELKARIGAEANAISDANLKLLKSGTTYEQITKKVKKLAEEQDKLKDERTQRLSAAVRAAGGPVAELTDRFGAFKEIIGGAGGKMALFVGGTAALVAAVAAVVLGIGAAAAAFTRFVITSANAARSAGLLREAFTGSAEDSGRLGEQVDLLATKVPTAKGQLNELAASLRKSGLSGQTLVDTFNAVGQASAALGEDTGNKFREILERGKLTGRVAINPMELMGSGVDFRSIADALSKQMGIGVKEAQAALYEGRVKLGDGASAIRTAIEKQVGGLNLRKMLDLNVLSEKFHETLAGLTKGVKIETLLEGLGRLSALFGDTTTTGRALKSLVTTFGTAFVGALEKCIPIAEGFFTGLVHGALKLQLEYQKLQLALLDTFGSPKVLANIDLFKLGVDGAKAVVGATMGILAGLAGAFVVLTAPVWATIAAFKYLGSAASEAWEKIKTIDWNGLGTSLVDGLVGGIMGGVDKVTGAVTELASRAKSSFKGAMGINSPAKEMVPLGRSLPEGVGVGVEQGTPALEAQVDSMVATPAAAAGGGGGARGGGAMVTLNLEVHVHGAGSDDAAAIVSSPSFLRMLTKAVEDLCTGAGVPVGAAS